LAGADDGYTRASVFLQPSLLGWKIVFEMHDVAAHDVAECVGNLLRATGGESECARIVLSRGPRRILGCDVDELVVIAKGQAFDARIKADDMPKLIGYPFDIACIFRARRIGSCKIQIIEQPIIGLEVT